MEKHKLEIYNHIIESSRSRKGEALSDLPLSKVVNILIEDFDFYDNTVGELYTPEYIFVFGEDLEDEFLIQFTCRDGFLGDLHGLFKRFDFIRIKDDKIIHKEDVV